MKNRVFVLALLITMNLQAQDADLIHGTTEMYESATEPLSDFLLSDTNPFPISANQYLKITDLRIHYFTSFFYTSNWVFHQAINVRGVLVNGHYVETSLELSKTPSGDYYFTGNSESCSSLRSPRARFSDMGCELGGDYHATLKN